MTDQSATSPQGSSDAVRGSQGPQAPKVVSADEGNTLSTLSNLWPYIWPSDRPDLKRRVLLALLALIIAKIVTVFSPYFFAWSTGCADRH